MNIQKYIDIAITLLIRYVPQLLLAIAVLFVGFWIIGRLTRVLRRGMELRGMDVSLRSFLRSLVSLGLKILLLFTVAEMVGIRTTSLIAILGAAGLAVGLALQNSLSNFAGGVLILIFNPYKIGDVITAQGLSGVVKEIQIFNTILQTEEGKTVILPNGAVSNNTIINHTTSGVLTFTIPLELNNAVDFSKAQERLMGLLRANKRVNDPSVSISKLNVGTYIVNVTGTTHVEDSPGVQRELLEQIKATLTGLQ